MAIAHTVLVYPIRPGKQEAWRRWMQTLCGSRRGECVALGQRLGIREARVWLVQLSRGDLAVITLEGADLPALRAAADPPLTAFERWMGQQLCELHEIDAASALRPFASELILDAARAPDIV
jgi:hypothetical protein